MARYDRGESHRLPSLFAPIGVGSTLYILSCVPRSQVVPWSIVDPRLVKVVGAIGGEGLAVYERRSLRGGRTIVRDIVEIARGSERDGIVVLVLQV